MDLDDRGLARMVHAEGRRHRPADPAAFDARWAERASGTAPAWLTVNPALLRAAQEWIATATYPEEHAYLAAHPELLDAAADVAVAEALLELPESASDRYTALRHAARQDGVDAAYRPVLMAVLAAEFAGAGPEAQRALLAHRRADLLSSEVTDALERLVQEGTGDNELARRAAALLAVAKVTDPGPVLDALAAPELFPGLLQSMISGASPAVLAMTALVAMTAVSDDDAANATAVFYLAVGMALNDEPEQAVDLVQTARMLDPAQVPRWIKTLGAIRPRSSPARALIPVLKSGPR
jgi:hypothetical protein